MAQQLKNGTEHDHQLSGYAEPKVGIANTSGLEPRGRAVLLRDYSPELEREDNLVKLPDTVRYTQMMMNQRAIVVAIGGSAWEDEKGGPRAKVGEKVLVTKFAGFIASRDVTADGKNYRMVNDNDIFGVITEERQNG